ncbi:MAG: metabolite traffic protein EboE [Phycisphaeraceae bacterium]|nr:metabolite traffic protein EboE [Phycisphaeraceae bacterium]
MIAYCTNVLDGDDLRGILPGAESFAAALRACPGSARWLADDGAMPLGLWLPWRAARTVADPDRARTLADWLAERHVRVRLLNGFPFDAFHAPVVKHRVYAPDWSLPPRAAFTRDLVRIAAALVPDGGRGSISTLPIAWRAGYGQAGLERAGAAIRSLVPFLAELEAGHGRFLHLDLEPEPGCVLDRPADVVRFFEAFLLRGQSSEDEARIRRHVGVCHDVCHAAVMFDAQAACLSAYARAGIRVGRIQISSAPEARLPAGDPAARAAAIEALSALAEPRWLHQASWRRADGTVTFHDDLPAALAALSREPAVAALPDAGGLEESVRVHFHVPIHLEVAAGLPTTRATIAEALGAARVLPDPPLLEIETYAWSVLPEMRGTAGEAKSPPDPAALAALVRRELDWASALAAGDGATGVTAP